jgi:4-cresol dehydrogenase (hydroxylating)
VQHAHLCYEELFETGRKLGVVPYRVGSVGMDLLLKHQTPHWATLRTIKQALDPSGIVSPGHYISL